MDSVCATALVRRGNGIGRRVGAKKSGENEVAVCVHLVEGLRVDWY